MPDSWDQVHGLDPRDASDAVRRMPNRYTAIEEYRHEVVDTLMKALRAN